MDSKSISVPRQGTLVPLKSMSYDQCSISKAPKDCFVYSSPCNPCFLTFMPSIYIFKHTFLEFDQVIPILQVPVNIQFSSVSCCQMETHPTTSGLYVWLEYQRLPWPHLGQWLPRTAHRNEFAIIFIPMVYYRERTQSKVSKRERHMGWSPEGTGSRVTNIHKLTPLGVTQDVLNSCSCVCW